MKQIYRKQKILLWKALIISNIVLKGRKWKVNFRSTLRNTVNKLQWTGTYFKSRLYYKRQCRTSHGSVLLTLNESLHQQEDELVPFSAMTSVQYSAWPQVVTYKTLVEWLKGYSWVPASQKQYFLQQCHILFLFKFLFQ